MEKNQELPISENVVGKRGHGDCVQRVITTENTSCQTEGISLTDYQKKLRDLNAKEKSLNKKEFELMQTSQQLTCAKTKIIALERTVGELHKENDLLKTNLLLAQSNGNNAVLQTDNSVKGINVTSIESRIAMLEFELLKSRVEKLETYNKPEPISNMKELDSKVQKVADCHQEMLSWMQKLSHSTMGSLSKSETGGGSKGDLPSISPFHSVRTSGCISENCFVNEKGDIAGEGCLNIGSNEDNNSMEGGPMFPILIGDGVSETDRTRVPVATGKASTDNNQMERRKERTLPKTGIHPTMQEGAPLQYRVPKTDQPFLYQARIRQAPPWRHPYPAPARQYPVMGIPTAKNVQQPQHRLYH